MDQKIDNHLKGNNVEGGYVGGNQTNNYYTTFHDSEREFVVTHKANIKPVSYFTGRETELQDLRQRIEERRKSVLVSGMGGIGKTHICRKLFEEYLNRCAGDENGPFRHLGYIEYDGDMGSSLQNCLKYKQQENLEQNREAAWRELEYLASDGKLLLFVDNVDKDISTDPGLQRLKGIPGSVILTSRQTSCGDEFEPYRIGFLSMEQCREIYEKIRYGGSGRKVRPEEEQELEYVIKKLAGRHTITVELLAHLAHTKLWTAKRLRDELEQKGFRLSFHKDGKFVNIQESYEVLYDLSELTEAEQNILEAFSVFPYIPLPAEICNQWLLADAGVSEDDDILMGLYQKGWVEFDVEQERYAMHPVYAQFIYGKCKPALEKHSGMIKECRKCLEIPESGSALQCLQYIPIAENMIERLDIGKNLEQISFLSVAAYLLYYAAEYKKAEELYRKILQIRERVLGEEHPDTATSYNNLAVVYRSQGKYQEAEELYRKSLQIRERELGEGHPDTAASYNNLAIVYESQGKYREAEELYKKSLQISERVLGEGHPDTAASYNNLAGVYENQGKYREAEELYKKSLQIRERVLGEGHPDTAASYNNLAVVYENQGKYREAEELYKKSLQIKERELGEGHPDTARSYNNLAGVYERRGKYREAEELHKKSLRIRERELGESHPDTAASYNNLAGVYKDQGKYREAEELYKKSLQISVRELGDSHPDTAVSYNNLAGVYSLQGDNTRALSYYLKAYKVFILKLGADHPHTQIVYRNMKHAYSKWNPDGNFEQWLEEQMKEER